jgi:hypothetical protein
VFDEAATQDLPRQPPSGHCAQHVLGAPQGQRHQELRECRCQGCGVAVELLCVRGELVLRRLREAIGGRRHCRRRRHEASSLGRTNLPPQLPSQHRRRRWMSCPHPAHTLAPASMFTLSTAPELRSWRSRCRLLRIPCSTNVTKADRTTDTLSHLIFLTTPFWS